MSALEQMTQKSVSIRLFGVFRSLAEKYGSTAAVQSATPLVQVQVAATATVSDVKKALRSELTQMYAGFAQSPESNLIDASAMASEHAVLCDEDPISELTETNICVLAILPPVCGG